MKLSQNEINFIKDNNSQFVSFKYLEPNGNLKQIDFSATNISDMDYFAYTDQVNLQTIKAFLDPFRNFPTTSFFCENIANESNARKLSTELLKNKLSKHDPISLEAEISFWILDDCQLQNAHLITSLIDKYANFRSDIVSTLEKINIYSAGCFQGHDQSESIISIKGENSIDLSDNILIAKFFIANMADSYGFSISFSSQDKKKSNISILLRYQKHTENVIQSIKENMESKGTLTDQYDDYNYANIKSINLHETNRNKSIKISLICNDFFVSYLTTARILSS